MNEYPEYENNPKVTETPVAPEMPVAEPAPAVIEAEQPVTEPVAFAPEQIGQNGSYQALTGGIA